MQCNPNAPGQYGSRPLHCASQEGHFHLIKMQDLNSFDVVLPSFDVVVLSFDVDVTSFDVVNSFDVS